MKRLRIDAFRNLAGIDIAPHRRLNVITGANGAGKTSVLEAIYFLGRRRSFRSRRLDRLVQWGAEEARVVADRGADRLGIARRPGATRLRLNGKEGAARSELAARLPVQVINTEHQRLLLDGPRVRRQFMDWGTFHVEPRFHATAQRYHQALRQRTAALRRDDQRAEAAWRPLLAEAAAELDAARERFVSALHEAWDPRARSWLGASGLSLDYYRGGDRGASWQHILETSLDRDRDAGFTTRGPHRADLVLRYNGVPASEALSRGQQKLLVVALLVAETRLWAERGAEPILLIDDLPADLDRTHLAAVLDTITDEPIQAFLTAIDAAALPPLPPAQWYAVRDGALASMV